MCGIIGVSGKLDNANEVVINGLKSLEYRGYDSWGVGSQGEDLRVRISKQIGKLSGSEKTLTQIASKPSNLAIGHTRWATHGGVTQDNSHPHLSCNGDIALVHNGIIENYQALRNYLIAKKHIFRSQTDSEVIVHLIEEERLGTNNLAEAVYRAVQKLSGSFAIVVIEQGKKELIGVRRGSPLVLGVDENNSYLASDVPAFITQTNKVIFINDGELVIARDGKVKIISLVDQSIKEPEFGVVTWNPEQAQKGEYAHFMLKEIHEQPQTILRAIAHPDEEIKKIADKINKAFGTFFVACGSAYHATLTATYLFSQVAGKHVNICVASEFPNYEHFIKNKTLLVAISQSGETADTLDAVRAAKERGAQVLGIVNVEGSTLTREAHDYILTQAGPEICVLATKSFTSQLALVTLITYTAAGLYDQGKTLVSKAAEAIEKFLNSPKEKLKIKKIAQRIFRQNHLYTIGRSLNHPTALEAALKIKEVSYIHAEGFAGGELKHGSIALIEKGTPVLAFAANDDVYDEIISNAMEVKARGAYVIGISPKNNDAFNEWIEVADLPLAMPIVGSVPAQLLAYELAVARGTDPDKPRNLAKSVTVK